MSEIARRFWTRNTEGLKPRVGELEPDLSSLAKTLVQAQRFDLLDTHEDSDLLFSGVHEFKIDDVVDGKHSRERSATAEVGFNPRTLAESGVFLELSTDSNDKSSDLDLVRSYSIGSNGVAVDLVLGEPVDADSQESSEIEQALNRIEAQLNQRVSSAEYYRQDRITTIRNRILGIGGTVVGVALGTGLVLGGLKLWVWDPNEAAEELRQSYDQQDHLLPGEGFTIENHSFTPMSPSEFETIPSYGGNDTDLDNPRIVTLSASEGCADVKVKIPTGSELFVALPEDSLFINYHYDTTISEEGFLICLTEPVPSDGFDESLKVAVQLR